MRRFALATVMTALTLGGVGQAQAFNDCRNNQLAGAVVGGVVGGLAGNALTRDRVIVQRGFQPRGFRGRGFRNRGFRVRRGNRGAGIALGALAGGLVGSQLAKGTSDCNRVVHHGQVVHHTPTHVKRAYPVRGFHNGIDHNAARLGDPFGGRSIPYQGSGTLAGGPIVTETELECRTTARITTLPDGRSIEESVDVCREGPQGAWIIRDPNF